MSCPSSSEAGLQARASPAVPPRRPLPSAFSASHSRSSHPRAPGPSRLGELEAVDAEVLIVQGENDAFGMPAAAPRRTVCVVPGDHSLRRGLAGAAPLVAEWLQRVVAQ